MKVLRSISAFLLALLVLVSSTSFVVGVHICMGKVQEVAFLSKADGCQMAKLPACHRTSHPCCQDEVVVHKADDIKGSVVDFALQCPTPIDLAQASFIISEIIPTKQATSAAYHSYDPPLPSTDITVEYRVLLI